MIPARAMQSPVNSNRPASGPAAACLMLEALHCADRPARRRAEASGWSRRGRRRADGTWSCGGVGQLGCDRNRRDCDGSEHNRASYRSLAQDGEMVALGSVGAVGGAPVPPPWRLVAIAAQSQLRNDRLSESDLPVHRWLLFLRGKHRGCVARGGEIIGVDSCDGLGPRRWRSALRLRPTRSSGVGVSGGGEWRQPRTTGCSSRSVAGRLGGGVVWARPVMCPVSRSVSYHSSVAVALESVASLRCRRRTVASSGGSCGRLPPPVPDSVSIDPLDTIASMMSDNANAPETGILWLSGPRSRS